MEEESWEKIRIGELSRHYFSPTAQTMWWVIESLYTNLSHTRDNVLEYPGTKPLHAV